MAPRDRQFSISSRCELLPYLMTLPLGLSRKQAKDLLRFREVTMKRIANIKHDTGWSRATLSLSRRSSRARLNRD